jgi:hypothetical protein
MARSTTHQFSTPVVRETPRPVPNGVGSATW